MRKPKIIFFYSHEKEIALGHELCPEASVMTLPLNESLKEEQRYPKNSLVIVWDSTKEGKGLTILNEIKQKLPESPLFLMAQYPSKEYLMTAINCKITNFFSLPDKKKNLQAAIDKVLKSQSRNSAVHVFKNWWNRVQHYVQSIHSSNAKLSKSSNVEFSGIAPASLLPFLSKDSEQDDTYDLSVQFFGQLKINFRGKTVPSIRGKKNTSVLAYLLLHHHKSVHRDILIDRFWSDYNTAAAKNSLNVAICSIRKDLSKVIKDQEVILFENESYCINPELEIITDIEKFTYYWEKGKAIEATQGLKNALHAYNKAVALCQEDFLGNLRFEDWCESERDNLREIYLFILNRLSTYFYEQQNYYGCINICKKMLSKDECMEEVHRKLIKCYYALGLSDLAFKQYFKCKKIMKEELDLQLSKPTVDLLESIKAGKAIL